MNVKRGVPSPLHNYSVPIQAGRYVFVCGQRLQSRGIVMNEQKKRALASVDEKAALYEKIAEQIWENPELSLKEYRATALYCEALRALGFTVSEKLCGIDTAFCGSFGSGAPVIGILGEYDALSGLSQAAGTTKEAPP